MDDHLLGLVVDARYRIETLLGSGAMGSVYRARHVKLGRAFAVKLLHPRLLDDAKLRRRFEREAEVAGTLQHPNVVGVVDVGTTPDGRGYMVMEHADGPTLAQILEGGTIAGARMIDLVRQICDGLQHAHELGLIHRDLKPENIIVERAGGDELPRIVDFGIALLREDSSPGGRERLTSVGLVLGTPHYMAPEHATGGAVDHRIDLFALGVICFEMLTGRRPFDGDGVAVALANLTEPTPAMRDRVPGCCVDPLLEAFTRKLLMKSPDDRPGSARQARMLLDLIERDRDAAAVALGLEEPPRHALGSASMPVPSAPRIDLAPEARRPRPWPWKLVMLAVVVLLVATALA